MKEIKYKADDILKRYWSDYSIPVSPSKILTRIGVVIITNPYLKESGLYYPNGYHNHPTVEYNPECSNIRIRFILAHMLAHHVLKHNSNEHIFTNDESILLSEQEANIFAIHLLIPNACLQMAISSNIIELSKFFKVSKAAMNYKLKYLGYTI